jgi:hypothetical protein
MLLTIDKSKVAKLLKASPPQYIVTTSHVMVADAPDVKIPSSAIYGTSFAAPAVAVDAKTFISSLRRKVVESGMKLKTPDELDREIEEMKRD